MVSLQAPNTIDISIMTKMMRHVDWVFTRFQVRSDSFTADSIVKERADNGDVAEFSEVVILREARKRMEKLDARWIGPVLWALRWMLVGFISDLVKSADARDRVAGMETSLSKRGRRSTSALLETRAVGWFNYKYLESDYNAKEVMQCVGSQVKNFDAGLPVTFLSEVDQL